MNKTMPEERLRQVLRGRHVLIVEDEVELSQSLQELFNRYGTGTTTTRRCVKGPTNGGLDALLAQDPPYDLVVVDVRLPPDEHKLNLFKGLQEQRRKHLRNLMGLPGAGEGEERDELRSLRSKMAALDTEIHDCIDLDGGIRMVEDWAKEMRKSHGEGWHPQTTILYLTGRTADDARKRALQAVTGSQWLTKPVTSARVVNAAAALLDNLKLAGG
jgi:DNA-binding response OmpR family regulator